MHTSARQLARATAATIPSTELELSQLFAQAENALAMASWHLRQPSANVPGATRKAVQVLAALNQLHDLAAQAGPFESVVEG
jgi:hypothetical protein